jgi:hypothetical protein
VVETGEGLLDDGPVREAEDANDLGGGNVGGEKEKEHLKRVEEKEESQLCSVTGLQPYGYHLCNTAESANPTLMNPKESIAVYDRLLNHAAKVETER